MAETREGMGDGVDVGRGVSDALNEADGGRGWLTSGGSRSSGGTVPVGAVETDVVEDGVWLPVVDEEILLGDWDFGGEGGCEAAAETIGERVFVQPGKARIEESCGEEEALGILRFWIATGVTGAEEIVGLGDGEVLGSTSVSPVETSAVCAPPALKSCFRLAIPTPKMMPAAGRNIQAACLLSIGNNQLLPMVKEDCSFGVSGISIGRFSEMEVTSFI